MKKNLFKKSMSVFLSVLMLMSCWVFFPGMLSIEADAAATDTTYRKNTDKYGTPYWTPTDSNTRWVLWGESRDANKAHFYMQMPKTIYLDKDETLQSAGYKLAIEWSYGDSTSYRIAIAPAVWGYGAGSASGSEGSEFLTMTELFNGYNSNVSFHAGASNEYGVNGYTNANQADLRQDDGFDGNKGVITLKNMGQTSNKYNNIYLIGDPIAVGSGRYSTTGINPDFILTQKWGSNWSRNNAAIDMENVKPTTVSEQLYGWNEVWWDVVIYDKSTLYNAINNANSVYNANRQYSSYVLNNGLSKIAQLTNEGGTLLGIREQTNDTIQAKATAINNAAGTLQFQAKNANLIAKVNEAKALQAKAGYNTLYTQASRQNLQAAIETATSNSLYSATTVYSIANNTDAGARAAAEQTTINNLVNSIATAMNSLERVYDIGYDNLFSFADWALNPIKSTLSNSTLEIDAAAGTIALKHDGSTSGTDNNTNQGADASWYKAKVEGDTEYVLTWKTEGTGRAQIHVFYTTGNQWTYNVNSNYNSGSHWFVQNGDLPYSTTMGKHEVAFTTLPEADGLVFRFGTSNAGDAITFSDIRLVKKTDYDAYANKYTTAREGFSVGETKALTYTPVRDGYVFDGWYTADGEKVTDVSGFLASDVVYAHWSQKFTVTFKNWDGTVLKTQEVAPGAAATAPSNPPKAADSDYEYDFAGWDNDFTNVQSDITVTANFTPKAHTGISKTYASPATCTSAAKYTQLCTACGYVWTEVFDDVNMPALGHTYERENPASTVVTGTSTGKTDDDVHTIKCNACDATTTVKHNFIEDPNHPATEATCVIAGKVYYKCACLEEKTVEGSTNSNKHVNTELKDVKAAKCGVEGYTGDTYCNDCKKTVATGSTTPALEHEFKTYNYNDDAKCGVNGTETAVCDREGCNEEDQRIKENSALEHQFKNYVDQGDATCAKEGTEVAICDRADCNETNSRSTGKKREHKFEGIVQDNKNGTHSFECSYDDCTVYGATVNCSVWDPTDEGCKCNVCGYTKGHTYGNWEQNDDNTENAPGKMTRTCLVCGDTDTTSCSYKSVKTPANCEGDAYTTYTCTDTNCGHGYIEIEPNTATGHKFEGEYTYDTENDKHQQACINADCTAKGVGTTKDSWADCSWTYDNAGEGKHTASCVCDNSEDQTCSGGEATCTAQAVCQFCETAYGERADHNYTGKDEYLFLATEATCTENETYYFYCIACKQTAEGVGTYEKPNTMKPHDYTGDTEYLYKATEAECEVNETYYTYCSACKASSEGTDAEDTFEKADTALTHKFDGTTVCNNDGTHTITCSQTNTAGWACDETDVFNCEDTAKLVAVNQATCTAAGYNEYVCLLCDYTWEATTDPALGHEYTKKIYNNSEFVKEEANCEHATIYWYACKWCDANGKDETDTETYSELFFVSGEVRKHDFQTKADAKYIAEPATCFAAAKYLTSCKYEDCGKSSEEVYGEGKGTKFSSGTALEHDWEKVEDEKYLATPADCANDATYYYECSLCENSSEDYGDGATWTKEGSKSGHTMTHKEANAATCDAAGNYEYWYCSTCKKYYKDAEGEEAYLGESETVIKKREHDIVNVEYKAATCEKDGNPAYKYCKYDDCNYTTLPAELGEGYKAAGHNFTGAYYCDTVRNYHAKYCANANCDMVTLTDAEGNPYQVKTFGMVVDGVQVKYEVEYDGLDYVIKGGEKCSFTYTESTVDGVHSHANTCVCGNNNTKVYSDEETFVKTVAPTCTTDGYDSYECPDCDATWKKNEVDRLNHTPDEKATSNGDGTHSIYCIVEGCGYKISTDKCSGGEATCSALAECEVCEGTYGEYGTHVYDTEWVYQNDAECEKNGTEKNTCTACKQEQTRDAEGTALEHVMSEYVYELPAGVTIEGFDASALKEPSCCEEGYAISYCTLCVKKYKTKNVSKDSTAHVWETDEDSEDGLKWITAGGNCATGVTMINKCTVCDKTQSKVITESHNWVVNTRVEANCEEDGYIVFKCSACSFTLLFDKNYEGFPVFNDVDYKLTEKLGHTWERDGSTDELVVDKESTCAIAGRGHYICGDCQDKSESVEIEKLEHRYVEIAEQKVSCTIDGYKAYVKCVACSYDQHLDAEWLAVEGNYTPATGHADNNNDGKCDGCKKEVVGDETDKCECICHKDSWFSKIIYKILRFFWKLFKIGKSCDCGAVHY